MMELELVLRMKLFAVLLQLLLEMLCDLLCRCIAILVNPSLGQTYHLAWFWSKGGFQMCPGRNPGHSGVLVVIDHLELLAWLYLQSYKGFLKMLECALSGKDFLP